MISMNGPSFMVATDPGASPDHSPSWLRLAIGGSAALFIGMGLGRFSYAPMIPVLIEHAGLSAAEAGYIGASNLAGFLFGVLFHPVLRARLGERHTLRVCLVTAFVCLAACAVPMGAEQLFPWLAFWRGLVGITVGVIMVQALAVATRAAPADKLGLATGIVFTGVGGGIFLSGVAMSALLNHGLGVTWLGIAGLGTGAVAIGWWAFGADIPDIAAPAPDTGGTGGNMRGTAMRLVAAQSLFVIGLIPHTIFWIDYIVRGLGHPMTTGGLHWALFGLGALAGTALWGGLADRIGFRAGLVLIFASLAAGLIFPALHPAAAVLFASSVVVGAQPGCSALLSGRTQQIFGDREMPRVWRQMTLVGSLGQGIGGYLLVALFDASGSYAAIFLIGGVAMSIGAVISATLKDA